MLGAKPMPPPGPCATSNLGMPLAASDPGTFPARGLTFCMATTFCSAVGKRLCRIIGGVDEWRVGCTGDTPGRVYTYGDTYDPARCVADQYLGPTSCKDDASCAPVDALAPTSCDDGLGVTHMSGNVQEWVDVCADGSCEVRGGSYADYGSDTACSYPDPHPPRVVGMGDALPTVGVRCCADP